MSPALEQLAELELLTWDEALLINAHLGSLETFDLLEPSLQRKLWLANALVEFDPEWPGVTMH